MEPLSESDIDGLVLERELLGESEQSHAKRIFKEHLVPAAFSIAHIACFSTNEKLRLDAAKYVVERNLGRIQDDPPKQDDDPYEKLLNACLAEASPTESTGEAA